MLRAIMDISSPAFSLADRPRMGHSGHQGSQTPGRPILHFVSSSRRPRQGNGDYVIDPSSMVQFLCSCREAVPSSRPARCAGHRAQRPSRLAVAVAFVLAPPSEGHALTVPSTVPRLRRLGRRRSCRPGQFEVAPLVENRPRDAGQLVASAIASTLWCSRFLAASIQALSP